MKKILLISVFIAFIFSGCKKIDKLTQFDMEYNSTVVIPSTLGTNLPYNIWTPEIESNSEEIFSINDTRKDLLEEVILKQMNLTLTSPTNANFNFLNDIEIYIKAEGLSEILVAWKYDIPDESLKTLDLNVAENDLKEYIKKDTFSLRVNTITDQLLTSDHEINIHTLFFVDAQIIV